MLKAIVWQERFRCNYSCSYCEIYSRKEPLPFPSWEKWVEVFNRLKPPILDITGGEPFLNKNIVDLIEALDPDIKLGLTTNLSFSIQDFVKRIPASRFVNITLSYHPTQKFNPDIFKGRAFYLASHGFPININFVAHPEQMYLIPSVIQFFRVNQSHGLRVHVDPFAEKGNEIYNYTPEELSFLQNFVGADRMNRVQDNGMGNTVMCSGGRDYIQIDPFGNAYRCMTYHLKGLEPIGNVFDENFSLNQEDKICHFAQECGGCDRDKVTMQKLMIEVV